MTALNADDLFRLRFLRAARLSPVGDRVVSTVSRVEDEVEYVELFLGGPDAPFELMEVPEAVRVEAPTWSPLGDRIASVVDGRLRIVDVADGSVSEPLTPADSSVDGDPSWSPQGDRIVVSLIHRRSPPATRIVTEWAYKAEGRGFIDDIDQAVYEIRVADGASRRLVSAELGFSMQPRWNPVTSEVLFFSTHDPVPFASYPPSLGVVDADSGALRELLTPDQWFVTDAQWTPNGERVVFIGDRDPDLPMPYTGVWVMETDGSAATLRTPGATVKPELQTHHDMPAWDLTSNQLAVPGDDVAFVTVQARGDAEIWRIGLSGDVANAPVLTGPRSCIILGANARTGELLYAESSLRSPTELWISAMDGADERRLTDLNDAVLASWPEVEIETYVAKSGDGLEVESWFMRPIVETDEALPTVLYIHGGPYAATGNAFRYDLLMLASQGWGVAFGNFRGSAGYGPDHVRGIVGDWGRNGFDDHMAVIDRAIELGFSDPSRLGVWGASHGGFATLWVVTHTNRFRAAVAEASVANWVTSYYHSDMPEGVKDEMGGTPLEAPETYRLRSPLTYIAQCTTPTMVIHGEQDLRCPVADAEQVFRSLLDVGCPTELVLLADADHLGDSLGPIAARRGQNDALLRWFGPRL